jgi:hypothetical protein
LTSLFFSLPQIIALAGKSKSYAERLFDFPEVGPLQPADARYALQAPVQAQGASFTDEALDEKTVETAA